MKEVAAYKMKHGLPIEDASREAVVLEAAVEEAVGKGLDATAVHSFYQSQINAARSIQQRWIAHWADHTVPEARDLHNEIRPALLSIGTELVESIAQYVKLHGGFVLKDLDEQVSRITVEMLDEKYERAILVSLAGIQLSP